MASEPLSTEIPRELSANLNEYCKVSRLRKKDVVAASIRHFLIMSDDARDRVFREYVDSMVSGGDSA